MQTFPSYLDISGVSIRCVVGNGELFGIGANGRMRATRGLRENTRREECEKRKYETAGREWVG